MLAFSNVCLTHFGPRARGVDMRRQLLACTLLCAVIVSAEEKCGNPVFSLPQTWGWTTTLVQPVQPAVLSVQEAVACSYFAGQQTCCDAETLRQASAVLIEVKNTVALVQDIISHNNYTEWLVMAVRLAVNATCAEADVPDCEHKLNDVLGSYEVPLLNAMEDIVDKEDDCVDGLLAYATGMVCFVCEEDWQKYLNVKKKEIFLATNTCDQVHNACLPVANSVVGLMDIALDMVNAVMNALQLELDIAALVEDLPDLCGGTLKEQGDCREYICHNVANGFATPAQSNWGELAYIKNSTAGATAPSMEQTNTEGTDSEVVRREVLQEVHARANNGIVGLHLEVSSLFRRAAGKISQAVGGNGEAKGTADSTYGSSADIRIVPGNESSLFTNHSFNVYISDGYDAYKIGCASDNSLCPQKFFPGWAIGLVCVSVVAVFGFLVFLVVRRRRYGYLPIN